MSTAGSVHAKVIDLGKHVLKMTTDAGSGHPSSALSILHTVVTLMYRQMRWDPADPWNPDADRLVLSEGHAVPAIYAAYADLGGIVGHSPEDKRRLTIDDLPTLRDATSVLDGHPNPAEGFPFFDAATGSLGQGLSVGAGLGLAARLRQSNRHVYVLIGDGESREGQIWEAADFIADQKLPNVTAFFNCNGQGQADYVSHQQSAEVLAAKLAAYGWHAIPVQGHDPDALLDAFQKAVADARPVALVASTQKGWGVESIQAKTCHGKPVAKADLAAALASLDETANRIGVANAPKLPPPQAMPSNPQSPTRTPKAAPAPLSFTDAIAAAKLTSAVEKNALSTRRAYGATLLALGKADERIVALDADVSNSTFAEMFGHQFPSRFFECKIAEQNMVSAGAGLAAAGMIPFASSFAKFIARAYDQVEMASITRANLKLVGSHSGVSLASDGPSQMGLCDVAFFHSFTSVDSTPTAVVSANAPRPSTPPAGAPALISLQPADAVAAFHLTVLMARHTGMCYMRTHRPDVPLLYKPDQSFEIGGVNLLNRGSAVALVSSGYMIHICRQAIDALAKQNIPCTLIDAYCLPMNAKALIAAGAECGHRYLVVEDNYTGGLGSAVAEIISSARPSTTARVESMTCRRIPKSARTPEETLAMVGLSATDIAGRARSM